MNPYQPPVATCSFALDGGGFSKTSKSAVPYLLGLALASVAAVGTIIRCVVELKTVKLWYNNALANGGESLVAIFALALATCLSLVAMTCIRKFVDAERSTYSHGLVLIAIVAMVPRVLLDPATCWTPTWPTYALTMTGVVALGILLRQLRPRLRQQT